VEPSYVTYDEITDDWCRDHFDHLSQGLAQQFHAVMGTMRSQCPVAHSDRHGGFWVVSRYEDVFRVAQDWETFSSAHGLSVPVGAYRVPNIPVEFDPPLQRAYKRAINPHVTPAKIASWEGSTRALVARTVDEFVEAGQCEFMEDFAHPFPAFAFFDAALDAPRGEVDHVATLASVSAHPYDPTAAASWAALAEWIGALIERRRAERAGGRPERGDLVDGILGADVDGRPMTDAEIIGSLQLLILGGLHTTTGALGMMVHRFCREPDIPELLRAHPELIPTAIEELLRLDAPMVAIARTATRDTELAGQHIAAGDKVMIYWASANRDGAVFDHPDEFELDRSSNRHLAFGVGPHRCAGSNIARLNLCVAVEEIVTRLRDLRLATDEEIEYHATVNRGPVSLPITFRPGPRHQPS
jgi:cytochrome P450